MIDTTLRENDSVDNHIDDHVDEEIRECFSKEDPKCFFVFAGAGSGKTRSLINILTFLDKERGESIAMNGKQIAVITYTNAACDEISRRLQYKPIFSVSTIHSFLWELIKSYQTDIKEWVRQSVEAEIKELEEKQLKGRGGKAGEKRAEDIRRKKERLAKIGTVKKFSYNPNGDNVGYDSLSHSEVIKMSTDFIMAEPTMQDILVTKYPILLIDESQDTKKELIDALLDVCEKHKNEFIVGMFGDTMQRIYNDGKENLAVCIPNDWAKPTKVMNHRSATRIVDLANAIRSTVDKQVQRARSDAEAGIVRLFISSPTVEKDSTEEKIAQIMAKDAGDDDWKDKAAYKSLILEHHMAASRFGFSNLYTPLNDSGKFDTPLRDGSITELSILAKMVLPLVKAYQEKNDFEVAKIVRKYSPLLGKKAFAIKTENQTEMLQDAGNAVESLMKLWSNNKIPSCLAVLRSVRDTGLFEVGDRVDDLLAEQYEGENQKIIALRAALSTLPHR